VAVHEALDGVGYYPAVGSGQRMHVISVVPAVNLPGVQDALVIHGRVDVDKPKHFEIQGQRNGVGEPGVHLTDGLAAE